jgi:adenosylmethionine-8-amino-7-oxononanoate aminotransferase
VAAGAREAGVLVRPLLRGVAVSPPLIVEQSQLADLADAIRAGLDRVGEPGSAQPDARSGV